VAVAVVPPPRVDVLRGEGEQDDPGRGEAGEQPHRCSTRQRSREPCASACKKHRNQGEGRDAPREPRVSPHHEGLEIVRVVRDADPRIARATRGGGSGPVDLVRPRPVGPEEDVAFSVDEPRGQRDGALDRAHPNGEHVIPGAEPEERHTPPFTGDDRRIPGASLDDRVVQKDVVRPHRPELEHRTADRRRQAERPGERDAGRHPRALPRVLHQARDDPPRAVEVGRRRAVRLRPKGGPHGGNGARHEKPADSHLAHGGEL
jgi:hypothetical protein